MRKEGFNRLAAWLVVVCMLTGMLVTVGQPMAVYAEGAAAPWTGMGTEEDPYLIYTAEELATVSEVVYEALNPEYSAAYFLQMEDIDLSSYTNWVPIGETGNTFTGTYDGGNHTISNLAITDAGVSVDGMADVGLFGRVGEAGALKNIRLENVQITNDDVRTRAGSLAGTNEGTVSNISSIVDIDISNPGDAIYAGGLLGGNLGTVSDSYCSGSINANGNTIYAGGLIGVNYGSLSNSYSTCSIGGSGELYFITGGLVGFGDGTVSNSYYDSETSGQSDDDKGIPKTTAEMMQLSTFEGWDFENTWKIGDGTSYPTLQWEPWTADEEATMDRYVLDQEIIADRDALTWDIIKGENIGESYITSDLILPSAGDRETTIGWSADIEGRINTDTGAVTRPIPDDGTQLVILTATISKTGGTSQTKDFYLEVLPFDLGDEDAVASDIAGLTWDSIKGDNIAENNITFNINPLPTMGANETTIDWSTSPEGWINTGTGVVTRPLTIQGDKVVTLTARVARGWGVQEKSFELTIKKYAWSWQGDGSQGNPYKVESAEHLNDVRNKMLENDGDVYFSQTADIDLSSYNNWVPIMSADPYGDPIGFPGTYNGNGYSIFNLKIDNDTEYNVGLFESVDYQGLLENIRLENADIRSSVGGDVGSLAGYNNGTVSNSSSNGSVTGGEDSYVGGLAGENYGTVSNSYSTCEVVSGANSRVGGLVGANYNETIENSYSIGIVTGEEGATIGGLVGENVDAIVSDSYYDSETSGQSDTGKGTPKTTDEMKQQATFEGWNFEDTWRIIDGYTYPKLQCERGSSEEIYTVTFDKNGGDIDASPTTMTVAYGGSIGTLPTAPTRTGYTFNGWNTAANGSSTAFTASTAVASNMTVYAQWRANTNNSGSSSSDRDERITTPQKVVPKTDGSIIPQETLGRLAEGGIAEYTVSTPLASITFSKEALYGISSQVSGDVKITVSKVGASTLSTEAQQAIGGRPVFDFSVTSGGKTISQFNGSVLVSIPYTPGAGEDINAIVIYYVNVAGKLEIVSNCAYDPTTGTVTFKTSHFSQYAVGYNKVSYKDVAANAWYSDAVGFIAARGITTGTGDGDFSPEDKLTRGQFLVMIMRAYGLTPDENPRDNFADAGNTYYTGYLAAAKRLGILDGVGNNMYAPDKKITNQEMYTLLYNMLKTMGELPEGTAGKPLTVYSDSAQIEAWAKDAMTLFAVTGTIEDRSGKLNPKDTTNRALMAQVLYNLLSK